MKDIFYEIIDEAKDGYVVIDGEKWPIGFNTMIYENGICKKENYNDNNISTLYIKDEVGFFKLLQEYIDLEFSKRRKCIPFYGEDAEKNYTKFLISYLMVNASTEDFVNSKNYIRKMIDFLNDNTFNNLCGGISMQLGGVFEGCNIRVKNSIQSVMMETPNKMEISIESDDGEFSYSLPTISYGISDLYGKKECYLYSILNSKQNDDMNEEEKKFSKKIWRKLYKINDGVSEGDNDISDISRVSPSAVLSLTIFLTLLNSVDISDVKGVPYLPLRYFSRDVMAKEKSGEQREELLERNLRIQGNVTDKFIRTFLRAAYHFDDCDVVLLPYEIDECVHFKIGKSLKCNNQLLDDTIVGVESGIRKR